MPSKPVERENLTVFTLYWDYIRICVVKLDAWVGWVPAMQRFIEYTLLEKRFADVATCSTKAHIIVHTLVISELLHIVK